jgi:hypothetical protein
MLTFASPLFPFAFFFRALAPQGQKTTVLGAASSRSPRHNSLRRAGAKHRRPLGKLDNCGSIDFLRKTKQSMVSLAYAPLLFVLLSLANFCPVEGEREGVGARATPSTSRANGAARGMTPRHLWTRGQSLLYVERGVSFFYFGGSQKRGG